MILMTKARVEEDPTDDSKYMFSFYLLDTSTNTPSTVVLKYPKDDMPPSSEIVAGIVSVEPDLQIAPY